MYLMDVVGILSYIYDSHNKRKSTLWMWCRYAFIIKGWDILRILGECLLISSLPGKSLRMLVDTARLAERFNMHSQSLAWKT